MKRAILIGCPGPSHNFLKGTEPNIYQMRNFLKSSFGGNWLDTEIITLKNPTKFQIQSVLKAQSPSYTFIYFSGHGSVIHGQQMLEVNGGRIADTDLLDNSFKQLILVDSCRVVLSFEGLRGYEGYSGIRMPIANIQTHDIYNSTIQNSSWGKQIVHATEYGDYAYYKDTGSYFVEELLNKSIFYSPDNNVRAVMIDKILGSFRVYIDSEKKYQIPKMTYSVGHLSVPFSLAVPKPLFPNQIF